MKVHRLSGKELLKAVGVGILTSVILSAIMVTAMKSGVSPMPAPVALIFAQTLFATELPLPVGLLFHVAWVTLWSVVYMVLFWDSLAFRRAAALAVFLLALTWLVFFPFIGRGLFGLGLGPQVLMGAVMTHVLFAIVLWAIARWTFGTRHAPADERYS